jgi:hypothetical protein
VLPRVASAVLRGEPETGQNARMKNAWIAVLMAACGGKGGTAPVQQPKETQGGFWDVLAVPGSQWVLHDSMSEDDPKPALTIRVAEVRQVGEARVVTLAGSVTRGDGEAEEVTATPSIDGARWVVTPRGLWMFDADADDAAIRTAIAGAPHWLSPPVDVETQTGRYMNVTKIGDETVVCIGEVPDLGGEDCPDVCGGGMCISATAGIVQMDAQWAPDPYSVYEADGYQRFEGPSQ